MTNFPEQAADFDAGAMENWGLITGRTSAFLFDAEKSDLAAKKRVAVVQSHEVRLSSSFLSHAQSNDASTGRSYVS